MVKCLALRFADLEIDTPRRVDPLGVPVCLVRLETDEVLAVSDICSHEEYELSDGEVENATIECVAHGSRFDLRTGQVNGLPAEDPVQTFPVTVEGGDVYVEVSTAHGRAAQIQRG